MLFGFLALRITKLLSVIAAAFAAMSGASAAIESSSREARLTQVIREVSLLETGTQSRRASLNEKVGERTAVRTGGDSRAELTFVDLTITRLGANTLYGFKKSGRQVELSGGSILLRVPKDSGGATILSRAVTVGITGTTLIFEYARASGTRTTVLEGSARVVLVGHTGEARVLHAGQMLQIPAGATRISQPVEIDLAQLMKTSPLIVGFRPLPSRDSIGAAIKQQQDRGQLNKNGAGGPPQPQNTSAPPPPGLPPGQPPGPGPGRR